MALVRPFRGLRYREPAGSLQSLVAPPYDVLNPEEREEYAARSPHNVVRLTLPEQHDDDRSKFVKYARSAAALAEWRREGALQPEAEPAFYRYRQTFSLPGIQEQFTRTSFIALIHIEPYARGVVLPHEQTFPKHREDRLRILEATRAHLECIFGLYEDPGREVLDALTAAPAGPIIELVSDDGVWQRLEPIYDPACCRALSELLADKKVWIADGHHRYETALAFREAIGDQSGEIAEDYMMMALGSMGDPGLALLPTHRMLRSPRFTEDELRTRFGGVFDCAACPAIELMDRIERSAHDGRPAIAVAVSGGGGLILTSKDRRATLALIGGEGTESLRGLDVSILHSVILDRLLAAKGTENVGYTRDAREAIDQAATGAATSFLMNPPTVDDMKTIAIGGEKMPQKSTYYYPKILSGLVLWSLNDF